MLSQLSASDGTKRNVCVDVGETQVWHCDVMCEVREKEMN